MLKQNVPAVERGEVKNVKNKIFDNFALKILAVICAILLWLVVLNISDYTITVEVKDIPVERLNEEALDELNQIYNVEKGDTVSILVKGRRSVVDRLSASDFVATADFSEMSITNTVQIHVEPKNSSLADSCTISIVDSTMKLKLEEKLSVSFPVRYNVTGTAKEGYACVATTATPNIVTITGPKSALGLVKDVCVDVDISGKADSFDTISEVYLVDAYGEKFTDEKIELSETSVKVSAMVYPTKEVDVSVNVTGRPEEGYGIGEISYQPQTVTIAGLPEDIQKVTEIRISDISVSGQSENLQTTIDITNYLPKDVYLAQASPEVAVNVTIEKLIQKIISMSSRDINMINKQSGCTYAITLSNDFKLTVSGLPADLNSLTVTDISPTIDCSNLVSGDNNNVEVTYKDINGVTYSVTGTVEVFVKNVRGN